MPALTDISPPLPRRGRPAMHWMSLSDVSAEIGMPVDIIERWLQILPGSMPGAERHDVHGWIIPSTTVRALKAPRKPGVELIQEATLEEVCTAMRRAKTVVYRWIEQKRIRARKVDSEWLIDVKSLYELPPKCPDWAINPFLKERAERAERAKKAAKQEGDSAA